MENSQKSGLDEKAPETASKAAQSSEKSPSAQSDSKTAVKCSCPPGCTGLPCCT
jgi:hypothetical protein